MNIRALIPIFYVKDVEAAIEFYTGKLGFSKAFQYGTYVGLRIGSQELHITDPGEPRQLAGAGSAYLISDEVDGYFLQVTTAGALPRSKPETRSYGMRDFAVQDPDGNQLTFGCDAE